MDYSDGRQLSAEQHIHQANEHEEQGELKEAVLSLREALRKGASDDYIHHRIAELYLIMDKPKKAVEEINTCFSEGLDGFLYRKILARAYLQSGNLKRALKEFKIALKKKSKDLELYSYLSQVQTKMGNMEEADLYMNKMKELQIENQQDERSEN